MQLYQPARHRRFFLETALAGACLALALATPVTAATTAPGAAKMPELPPIAYSMEGNYLAGRFASQQSDYAASANYFAEALLSDPEDPFLLERTLTFYLASGDFTDVRDYAERLQKADHGNPLAGLALGVDDFRRGRWTVAIEELKSTRSGPLLTLAAEVLSAWAEQGAGKTSLALQRLDKLNGEKWYTFFRDFHAGLIASTAGDEAQAAKSLKAALAVDDSGVIAIDAAARSIARSGDMDGARAVLDKALKNAPNHPILLATDADLKAGRRPAAFVRSPQGGAAEILSGLGSAMLRDNANDMGIIFLQMALALNPGADLTRITLAETLERAERYNDAIATLLKVSPKSPLKRNADIKVAFDYNSLDKLDDARATLERVIAKNPKDKEAMVSLGNILRVRKTYKDAATLYTRAIALIDGTPTEADWQLFYNRGITYERTDQWPAAESDFKKALELKPDQPLVLNYLGYSWVDKGMHLDEAMAMIRKAVEIDPTDGFIVDSLGWAHYKLGQYDAAVAELEKAIQIEPSDPTVNDHLGDAYWRVGRHLEAHFQWNHAKAGKPEADALAKIEEKIKNGLVDPPAPKTADGTAGKVAPAN